MAAPSIISAVDISGAGVTDANTGSTSITVPASCTGVAVLTGGYFPNATCLSAPDALTLRGTPIPTYAAGGDASGASHQGGIGFLEGSIASGAATLAWDWRLTDTPTDGILMVVAFIGGCATASAIRDSDGIQSATFADNALHSTKSLTALTDDLILGWMEGFESGVVSSGAWTNAAAFASYPSASGLFRSTYGRLGTATPTGNQTVGFTISQSSNDGSLQAIVIKPSAGPSLTKTGAGIIGP